MSISYSKLSFDLELVIMSQVLLCLLLVVTLSLQIPEVNLKDSGKDTQEKPTSNGGTKLHDTIKQSSCQPRETLVKVYDEFPDQVQYGFRPDCVPVKRCSGCCPDEATTCMPEYNSTLKVEFEVLRFYAIRSPQRIRLSFVAHAKCICRYKD